jgi:RND family efflux transporter MFP subunit
MSKLSFTIVLFCAAALVFGCTEAKTADLQAPTPVKVQPVESFSLNNGLRYSATIRPSTQMDLAFKNGGFVDSIYEVSGRLVEQGDTVAKGTVLAKLRQADFENRLNQADAQLSDARFVLASAKAKADDNQARLVRAEQDLARAEKLFNSQSLTKKDYDAAKADYESALARVQSAKADIDSAQYRVSAAEASVADANLTVQDTAIVAPMTGTIVDRNIEIGALAAAGKAAFVLADTRAVKAVFGVPDLEIRSIKPGMPLEVTSEAVPEQKFSGRITSISPAADEKSRIFETEVTIANPKDVLKAGMIASVVIGNTASKEKSPAVPLSAIVRSKDNSETYAAYVVETRGGQSSARLRNVKLGDAFGNMIVVKEGLTVGESVITVGATLVHDGGPVQIVP